jgi:two-component system chemotaxis response regulator CheY
MSLRILIVDEDRDSRDQLKDLLTRLGHQIVAEATGSSDSAGLFGSRPAKPEIALINVDVPFLDALHVISQVRKIHPGVNVIVMTATSTPAEEIKNVGALGVIRTPCNPDTVKSILSQFEVVYRENLKSGEHKRPSSVPTAKPRKFEP